jgi:hypothetical protein
MRRPLLEKLPRKSGMIYGQSAGTGRLPQGLLPQRLSRYNSSFAPPSVQPPCRGWHATLCSICPVPQRVMCNRLFVRRVRSLSIGSRQIGPSWQLYNTASRAPNCGSYPARELLLASASAHKNNVMRGYVSKIFASSQPRKMSAKRGAKCDQKMWCRPQCALLRSSKIIHGWTLFVV